MDDEIIESGFEVPVEIVPVEPWPVELIPIEIIPLNEWSQRIEEHEKAAKKRAPQQVPERDPDYVEKRGGRHNLSKEIFDELRLRAEEKRRARSERLRERGLITRGRGAAGTGKSRKVRRALARQKLLPVDRKCARCGKGPILESRKWVITPDGVPVCLSCWRLEKNSLTNTTE